jgi:YegS/Rv2252/BmrU family lipid kinase
MANIAFIFHGRIKHRNTIFMELQRTFGSAHQLKCFVTETAGHSVVLAEQAIREGYTHIICVGGDGSLNEVANGLMKAKANVPSDVWNNIRLGVLPMGTGNDFAKTLNTPKDAGGLKRIIESDKFKAIDLGLVVFHNKAGQKQSRYFINITDVGMGGVVAEHLSRYSKWMGAYLTYQRAILTTLLTYKHQPVKAVADTFTYEGSIMNFIVANGKYFGSGLGIAPDADAADGKFSIVILGEISLLDYIRNLGKVQKCQKISHPELHYKSAREVSIESPVGPLAIDMDGEFIGYSPMTVSVVPTSVRFLC